MLIERLYSVINETKQRELELLVEKIEAAKKRMRWKAFYFEQSDTRNNSKNIYYCLTRDKTPPI